MSDTKMLQMILDRVVALDLTTKTGFKDVNKRIDAVKKELTKRIDKLGMDLAHLSDDAPVIEDRITVK